MDRNEMPLGFSMALAMNPDAMQKFALLGEDQKQAIIAETHGIKSKTEMQRYVNKLVSYEQNTDKI